MSDAPAAQEMLRTAKTFEPVRKRFQPDALASKPVICVDIEGSITRVTKPARNLLEYGPEKEIDPCFFSHIHGKNLYQVMRDVADMVCYGKRQANWLLRVRTGLGRWRWYRMRAENRLNEDRQCILVHVRELTNS